MYVYNFSKEFAGAVETLQKRQTIRADRKDGKVPEPGEHIRLYTGMRTKSCRKLLDTSPIEVIRIQIDEDGEIPVVILGCRRLTRSEIWKLAEDDGFKTAVDFMFYIRKAYGLPFSGHLIKW